MWAVKRKKDLEVELIFKVQLGTKCVDYGMSRLSQRKLKFWGEYYVTGGKS